MIDPDSSSPIIILVGLLILHAFFAAIKEAIISMRRSRRLQLIEEGNQAAKLIDRLAENATHLLATEQLVLKFIGFFVVAFAAFVYTTPLAQAISGHNFIAMLIITITTVLLTLIFGELIPREIGRNYPESIALWGIYPVNFLSYFAAPLARLVTQFGWALTGRPNNGHDYGFGIITEEDLRTYVDASEEGGALNEDEKEMIYSIFDLDDTSAREVMVPRIDIVAVEVQTAIMEALDIILEEGHSRLPVYIDNIDNIVGILYAKDLLAHWRSGGELGPVQKLIRDVYYVPETKPVSDLLHELQTKKVQIAIVVDEYGGTAGLVTVEDIVEEIVGEIHDEYDSEEFFMQYISDDEYIFNGRVDLDDINALMSANLPTDENDTLGGLIYNTLGRVPEAGDALDVGDLHITVLEVIGRRIGTVKVERLRLDIQQTETAGESIKADKNTSPLVNNRPHNAVSEST